MPSHLEAKVQTPQQSMKSSLPHGPRLPPKPIVASFKIRPMEYRFHSYVEECGSHGQIDWEKTSSTYFVSSGMVRVENSSSTLNASRGLALVLFSPSPTRHPVSQLQLLIYAVNPSVYIWGSHLCSKR